MQVVGRFKVDQRPIDRRPAVTRPEASSCAAKHEIFQLRQQVVPLLLISNT